MCTLTVVATFVAWVTVMKLTSDVPADVNTPFGSRIYTPSGLYIATNVAYSTAFCMDRVERSVPIR